MPTRHRATSSGAAISRAWIGAVTCTSITPGAGCTPSRSCASTYGCSRTGASATRIRSTTSAASTELVERARASVLDFFRASSRSTKRSSPRTRPARYGWSGEGYPVPPARPSARRSTTTTRSTDPRVRPRPRSGDDVHPERRAGAARRGEPAGAPLVISTPSAITTTWLPSRRSRTSRASIRWGGSNTRTRTGGTCCSTPPRMCRPTGST